MGASVIPSNSQTKNDRATCVHVYVGKDLVRKDTTLYLHNNYNLFFFT